MAHFSRRQGNDSYYGARSYDNQRNNFQSFKRREGKKRSGAKFGTTVKGKPYVRGWNASRAMGLVTYFCTPNKKTKCVTTGKGRQVENWTCVVTSKLGKSLMSCFIDINTKKITFPDVAMVINPHAPNGGYCGGVGRKK